MDRLKCAKDVSGLIAKGIKFYCFSKKSCITKVIGYCSIAKYKIFNKKACWFEKYFDYWKIVVPLCIIPYFKTVEMGRYIFSLLYQLCIFFTVRPWNRHEL